MKNILRKSLYTTLVTSLLLTAGISSVSSVSAKEQTIGQRMTHHRAIFFLLARFYGPEPALINGSFELNDMEYVK